MLNRARYDTPCDHEMTLHSPNLTPAINELGGVRDSDSCASPASNQVLLKRRRRRRLDLKSLDGTLRESGRLYRELAEGRISMAECEVRSRALKRHAEILGSVRQAQQLEDLQRKLAELQGGSSVPPLLQHATRVTPEWLRDDPTEERSL
jgi:hypothetical protein